MGTRNRRQTIALSSMCSGKDPQLPLAKLDGKLSLYLWLPLERQLYTFTRQSESSARSVVVSVMF